MDWLEQKEAFMTETARYLRDLGAQDRPPLDTINNISQIRAYAQTATKDEWENEDYWGWWQENKPQYLT